MSVVEGGTPLILRFQPLRELVKHVDSFRL